MCVSCLFVSRKKRRVWQIDRTSLHHGLAVVLPKARPLPFRLHYVGSVISRSVNVMSTCSYVVCSEKSQYLWVTVNQIMQMEFSRPTNMLHYVHTPFALVESPCEI